MLRDKLKKNVARITGAYSPFGALEYIINQFDELLLQKQNIVKKESHYLVKEKCYHLFEKKCPSISFHFSKFTPCYLAISHTLVFY